MKSYEQNRIVFRAEGVLGDATQLDVYYDNRGEPYRKGVTFAFDDPLKRSYRSCFLEDHEAIELRDLLNRLYPTTK